DAPAAGSARLFYDRGAGFRLLDSYSAKVQAGSQVCRFLVPPGEYAAFRLEPFDQPGRVTIHDVRLASLQGREVRRFDLAQWIAQLPQDRIAIATNSLEVLSGHHSGVGIRFPNSLALQPSMSLAQSAIEFIFITAACSLL